MVFNKEKPPLAKALKGFDSIGRVWSPQFKSYYAKVMPGDYYVTVHEEAIYTVLGSCISVCIRDPIQKIGGMNHFMLPEREYAEHRGSGAMRSVARFGNYAMEYLINSILSNGGKKSNLEFKVFGGARMIRNMGNIGMENVDFATQYLQDEGFRISAQHVGGDLARKLYYFPLSGKVMMKTLRKTKNDTVTKRDRDYMKTVAKHDTGVKDTGTVELF